MPTYTYARANPNNPIHSIKGNEMNNGMYRVFTSKDMVITDNSQRVISGKLNNPVRKYFISIDANPWHNIKVSVPEQYKELIGAVLDKTARDILLDAVRNSTATPGELPASWFTEENLLDRATNGASDWMSKEELEEAWKASDTRKRIIETDNYKNNPAYRKTANAFAEMVLKLSGKTTFLEEKYQDWILSKLSESDIDTEFGTFVTMRISRMKGKEKKQELDLDILG